MANRVRLRATGVSFEYTVPFGQATNAAAGSQHNALTQTYAKGNLFDYSY